MEELDKEESKRRQTKTKNLRESNVAIAGRNKYTVGPGGSKHSM